MVILLRFHLFDLIVHSLIVGRSLNIANDTERYGEAVLIVHHGELELQRVVGVMTVMDKDVIHCISVFSNLYDLQAEALLNESVFVVFTENQWLAVFHVDGVLAAPLPRVR